MRDRGPGRALLLALTLLAAGCSSTPQRMPAACVGEPGVVASALREAPGAVALADGTPLSRCVATARTDADLQALGVRLVGVADGLRDRAAADPDAALRLGYLAGATRAGASASSGVTAQLARRVEQAAALQEGASAAASAAHARGLRAGERVG